MDARYNLLFVCRNNINRSPAAQYIALSKGMEYVNLQVDSAGILDPPEDEAKRTMKPEIRNALLFKRYSPGNFHPKEVRSELIDTSNLVLCMSKNQRDHLTSTYPHCEDKVFLLGAYPAREGEDIQDPGDVICIPHLPFLHYFPKLQKSFLFAWKTHLQRKDANYSVKVHRDTVGSLEGHVERVLSHLERDGKIRRNS